MDDNIKISGNWYRCIYERRRIQLQIVRRDRIPYSLSKFVPVPDTVVSSYCSLICHDGYSYAATRRQEQLQELVQRSFYFRSDVQYCIKDLYHGADYLHELTSTLHASSEDEWENRHSQLCLRPSNLTTI